MFRSLFIQCIIVTMLRFLNSMDKNFYCQNNICRQHFNINTNLYFFVILFRGFEFFYCITRSGCKKPFLDKFITAKNHHKHKNIVYFQYIFNSGSRFKIITKKIHFFIHGISKNLKAVQILFFPLTQFIKATYPYIFLF